MFPSARELGLPRSARALFDQLTQEPLGDWAQLEARILAHARSFEAASARSEFLPIRDARALGKNLPELAKFARLDGDSSDREAAVAQAYKFFRERLGLEVNP